MEEDRRNFVKMDRAKMMHSMVLRRLNTDKYSLMRLIVRQSELMEIIFSDAPEYPFAEKVMNYIIQLQQNIVKLMEEVEQARKTRLRVRREEEARQREREEARYMFEQVHSYSSVDE